MNKRSLFAFVVTSSLLTMPVHAAGIPQMDQTWYPNQLLWLAISFALLYAMVSLLIAPTAAKILRVRENAINDAIAQAEKAKAEAEGTRAQFTQGGNSARSKAAELLAQAQADITRDTNDSVSALDRDLAHKASTAEARIADAQSKALSSMHEATAELAATMAGKLLGRTVTADEAKAATTPVTKLKKAS